MDEKDAKKYRARVLSAARKAQVEKRRATRLRRGKSSPKALPRKNRMLRAKSAPPATKRKIAGVIASSKTLREAAKKLDVHAGTVINAKNDPEIKQYIEEIVAEQAMEAEITVGEVLRELKRLALSNSARFVRRVGDRIMPDFSRVTYSDMAAVQDMSFTDETWTDHAGKEHRRLFTDVKLRGKQQALDMLCKYFRLYGGDLAGAMGAGGALPAHMAAQAPSLTVQFVEPKKKAAKENEE